MAILGSLIVELKASTASFIDGMGGAAKTARTVGREIESSFASLGNAAASALAGFGPMGSMIAATLTTVGEKAGSAMASFGKMGGGMSLLAGAGAGATAAIGAAGVAALGFAAHTALTVAELEHLSQSTGVSVSTLSGFQYVAKQTGVDSETMTKSLERLSRSIFTAATAAPGTVNAFSRLGISVRDSEGNIKSAGTVMTELAGKFAGMQDGAAKTALAIQLFGRGGAALVPMLNEGVTGIAGLVAEAQSLGIVLDDQTVEAAHHFEQSLNTIKAAGEGMAIQLMRELLPGLQSIATALVAGLKDPQSSIRQVMEGFALLGKVVLATADTIWSALKQIGIWFGNLAIAIFEGLSAIGKVGYDIITGNVFALVDDVKEGYTRLKAVGQNFVNDSKAVWQDYAKFTAGINAPLPAAKAAKTGGAGPDLTAAAGKAVREPIVNISRTIDALRAETAAELELAGATNLSVAAQNMQKAAGEGDTIIAKMTAQVKDLAAAHRITAAQYSALIARIHEESAAVHALTAEKQVAKDAVAIDAELNKESLAYDRQIASLQAMAAAYAAGGAAIAASEIDAKLEADRQKVDQLQEEYTLLASTEGVSTEALARISGALSVANADLEEHGRQLTELRSLAYDVEINKQADALAGMAPYLESLNAAYLTNSEAVREAQVAIQLYNWQLAHPGATPEQIAAITAQFEQQSLQARQAQDAQVAAQFSIGALWDEQITKLERAREVMTTYGSSTLLIDAQIYDSENRLIQQWDQAAFKVGDFGAKFRGVMNELVIQGREAGAEIMNAILGAIDSVETGLAKLATGQKANFKGIFQGLAESITKAEIQKTVGSVAGALGFGNIPGLAAKADGSESSPFFVHIAGAAPGLLGGVVGGPGNTLGGAIEDWTAGGAGGGGGIFGKIFGGIGSLFGGGKAAGGDLTPGKWYVAGERGPEIIAPKQAGTVAPLDRLGGKNMQTTNVVNINGVKDFDLFRRSESQLMAQFHRQASIAYGRS